MLGLCRAIAINTDIVANKFDAVGTEEAFLKRQGHILRKANVQLASQICNEYFKGRCSTEYIIYDDPDASDGVKNYTSGLVQQIPRCVRIMDTYDEDDWPVNRAKGHHEVGIFGTVWSSKC